MSRNFRPPPPPPPRQQGQQQPRYDTIDSLFDRQKKADSMKSSAMNDIDGDDSTTDFSDNDSVLAMAKRLDAASVISDPSFIEGTAPHLRGVEPLGSGHGGGGGRGPGPAGLYGRDRDLDSIASESDDGSSSGSDSSSSSSSDSSSDSSFGERNPNRGRPMGQPRVGFHGPGGTGGSRHYNSGPPELNPNRGPSYQAGYDAGPPELNNSRGMPYDQGPPELNPNRGLNVKNNGKNVRFSTRGQRRTYNPKDNPSGGGGGGGASVGGASLGGGSAYSQGSNGRDRSRDRSRSRSPSGRSRDSRDSRLAEEKAIADAERRRKIKLIVLPVVVLIAVTIAIAIAVVIGKGSKAKDDDDGSPSDGKLQISVPTSSPTFTGLYNCIPGISGPVPTRGCLGFVTCNSFGRAVDDPVYCPTGTLYDVRANVCNHMDRVECNTSEDVEVTRNPISNPTRRPSPSPIASGNLAPEMTPEGEIMRVGPVTTLGQKLVFVGVSSPGDIQSFQQNLQNYLNIFYSPATLNQLNEDDELRSLSDVKIEVKVVNIEQRRRLLLRNRGLFGGGASEGDGVDLHLQKQQQRRRSEEVRFVAVYDQITTYKTTDPMISIDTIVSRPFDPAYTAVLVQQLRRNDPGTYSTLTEINYIDPYTTTATTVAPAKQPTTNAPTAEPTMKPTNPPTSAEVAATDRPTPFEPEETNPPTKNPTRRPTPSPITFSPTRPAIKFPAAITIQGLLWLDQNKNGLFETSEPPMEGLFVNLRECEKDRWRATTSTNESGQYQFVGVDEGSYYLDFFKPNPIDRYDFTRPNAGGDDASAVDSQVVELDGFQGRSACIEVREGFKQLTNAGYVRRETPPPSPRPSPPPTRRIVPRPTASPTKSPVAPELTPPPTPRAPQPTRPPTRMPTTPAPTQKPTTRAPTEPRYCAFITGDFATGDYDFKGCAFPCFSVNHSDCPEGMYCAITTACSR